MTNQHEDREIRRGKGRKFIQYCMYSSIGRTVKLGFIQLDVDLRQVAKCDKDSTSFASYHADRT